MIGICCVAVEAARFSEDVARSIIMAKGQLRGNKEAKKPKKPKQVVVPVGSFITAPPKTGKPIKVPH
jgi:hypothetical protein